MQKPEPDIREIKEAHRRSADKVRELLEQLEEAEREFAHLTERIRALSNSMPAKEYLSISPR